MLCFVRIVKKTKTVFKSRSLFTTNRRLPQNMKYLFNYRFETLDKTSVTHSSFAQVREFR